MSDGEVTPALHKFIAQHIESVEKLEVLLLVQSAPDTLWTVAEVFRPIQSSLASVTQKLENLTSEGLLIMHPDGRYQYRPRTEELAKRVTELQSAYRKRRIKVIELIFSANTNDLRAFADAFKLRKEKENE